MQSTQMQLATIHTTTRRMHPVDKSVFTVFTKKARFMKQISAVRSEKTKKLTATSANF